MINASHHIAMMWSVLRYGSVILQLVQVEVPYEGGKIFGRHLRHCESKYDTENVVSIIDDEVLRHTPTFH